MGIAIVAMGMQGWRSGESTRLQPMWPGFDSQIRHHVWVEFVGSLLCTERFFSVKNPNFKFTMSPISALWC